MQHLRGSAYTYQFLALDRSRFSKIFFVRLHVELKLLIAPIGPGQHNEHLFEWELKLTHPDCVQQGDSM